MDQNEEAVKRRLERLRFDHVHSMELLRATAAFEHAALRPPTLLNGGALIVFLALFGSLTPPFFDEDWAIAALLVWIVGLLSATLATATGYYSQFAFRKAHDRRIEANEAREFSKRLKAIQEKRRARGFLRKGFRRRRCAELSVLASFLLFILGVAFAFLAITESSRAQVIPLL